MRDLNKILLVDDDADIRTICTLVLESMGGFDVKTCEDGQGAIDCVKEFQPDLVVLDVMMPKLDGPDTLAALKRDVVTSDTPVVFLTAKNRRQDIEWLRGLGACDVLAKPFDPMSLPSTIREIWERHVASQI